MNHLIHVMRELGLHMLTKVLFQTSIQYLAMGICMCKSGIVNKLILKTDCQSFGCQIITLRRAHTENSMCIRGHSKIQHIEPCKGVR